MILLSKITAFRFWIVLIISVLASSSHNLQAAEKESELIVLTYNIHHGEGTDGKFDLQRIAKIITDSKANLVALQEVDVKTKRIGGTNAIAELGRLTGMKFAFGAAMPFQGGEYGQAVLSRFEIKNSKTHQLPQKEGREPRIAFETTIALSNSTETLTFVTTHLDHQIEEIRIDQAKKLNELFAAENKLAILAGDFNARPESKTMQLLLEKWTDASASAPAPTIPSDKPRSRIDYVLARPANAWQMVESKVLDEPIASDHRPVVVRLKFSSK